MPEVGEILNGPEQSEVLAKFLRTRRSNLAKIMQSPGPDDDALNDILDIAARVPDHRKLAPWRFIIFQGSARQNIGQHLGAAFQKNYPDLPLDRVMFESGRFLRAPLVVAVVANPKDCPRGTPKWEQHLSAGAVCYNMCLAAQAHGFGAQWLTEWYAYDPDVLAAMGVSSHEKIAGFIYIGTVDEAPSERARPDVSALVQYWA